MGRTTTASLSATIYNIGWLYRAPILFSLPSILESIFLPSVQETIYHYNHNNHQPSAFFHILVEPISPFSYPNARMDNILEMVDIARDMDAGN